MCVVHAATTNKNIYIYIIYIYHISTLPHCSTLPQICLAPLAVAVVSERQSIKTVSIMLGPLGLGPQNCENDMVRVSESIA